MATALIVLNDRREAADVADWIAALGYCPRHLREGNGDLSAYVSDDVDLLIEDERIDGPLRLAIARGLGRASKAGIVPIVRVQDDLRSAWRPVGPGLSFEPHARCPRPLTPADLSNAVREATAWREGLRARGLRQEVLLEIPSLVPALHEAVDFLIELLQGCSLKAEQLRQLRHVLIEMGQNAIEWGNRGRADRVVHLAHRTYDDRVELVVRDEGPGFDPKALPHAAKADDPVAHLEIRDQLGLREGGFGLMICRGLVDELRYNDAGNEVTLVKRLPLTAHHGLEAFHP